MASDIHVPTPENTDFNTNATDQDAFRIEVTDTGLSSPPPASLGVTLQVGDRDPISITLPHRSGGIYRGNFQRLVSDSVDDGVRGTQTVLGALRDLVIVRYKRTSTCVDQAVLRIGRPVDEDDNDPDDQSRQDVRQLRMHIVVFSQIGFDTLAAAISATATTIPVGSVANAHASGELLIGTEFIGYTGINTGTNTFTGCSRGLRGTTAQAYGGEVLVLYSMTEPCVTTDDLDNDLLLLDEQFAQSTIRLRRPVALDFGPSGQGRPLPGELLDGFDTTPTAPMTTPLADEVALVAYKDGIPNTIDAFYVEFVRMDSETIRGAAYFPLFNGTGNPIYSNWTVINASRGSPFTLGHECMHILLNLFHRDDSDPPEYELSLFYGEGTSETNSVTATKRIGPNATSLVTVGHDDTETIRNAAENLP